MNHGQEIKELSIYLEGLADAMATQPGAVCAPQHGSPFSGFKVTPASRILRASQWLDKLSRNVCGQGYVGCMGGEKCSSDHK